MALPGFAVFLLAFPDTWSMSDETVYLTSYTLQITFIHEFAGATSLLWWYDRTASPQAGDFYRK
jgi:hypothetical protein